MKNVTFLFLCVLPVFATGQDTLTLTPAEQEVYSIVNKVIEENRYTDQMQDDSAHVLPFGIIKEIGTTRYIIAIDSAEFKSNGAWFNAYMAIEFPGSEKKLAFAAKHIKFNPKGVVGGNQARLVLVSDHDIPISDKIILKLKNDGRNFVEWDCNGFKSVNMKGYFEFARDMLEPDISNNNDSVQKVTASFEINTADIHQFIAQVNISPFKLKGLKGWSFTVQDATVDMSEITNPIPLVFPQGYEHSSPGNPQMWTGFYLKQLKIKLPPELSKSNQPTEIVAQHLIIDKTGFTGNVSVHNVFSTSEGDMNGWGFSIDHLGAGFLSGHLTGGSLAGKVMIPAMKDNGVRYSATMFYNPQTEESDYVFTVSPANNLQFDVFAAEVNLYPSSLISVTKQNGRFLPKAILNGQIKFVHDNAQTPHLNFQQLTFETQAPYLTNGVFAFGNPQDSLSVENKVGKFPASIYHLSVVANPQKPKIRAGIRVNFMASQDQGFAAQTTVDIGAKIQMEGTKQNWQFDQVKINEVSLAIETQPFYLAGTIAFLEDDPVYGDGFAGALQFRLKSIMPDNCTLKGRFGSTTFRYFYVDAYVPVSFNIGATPMSVTHLAGGIYYHMEPVNTNATNFISQNLNALTPGLESQQYVPSENISLGFKAGAGFKYSAERVFNGDAMLDVSFTQSGGLNAIHLTGNAYSLSTVSERQTKPPPVKGFVNILYDNVNKIFDATFSATVNVPGRVTGSATAKFHIDPQVWFVCVGRPSAPASVTLLGLASASAYVLMGNQLEPMPPPFPQVASLVSQTGLDQQRNQAALANASGFAAGARIMSSVYKEFGWDFFSVYGGFAFGAGFDMMLANFGAGAHCSGSTETVGMNGWIAQGQLFAYLQGTIGIRGEIRRTEFDIPIISGTVAALLGGKIPNPSYLYGALACQYTILGFINGSFNFDFAAGNDCTIVN